MPNTLSGKPQDTDSRSALDAASAGIRMAEETMEKVEQWYHILEKFPRRFDPDVTDVPHDADPTGDFVESESFPMEEIGSCLKWLRQHLPGEDGGLLTECQKMISSARQLRRTLLLDARNRVGCMVQPSYAYYALMQRLERIADKIRIEGLPEQGEKEAAGQGGEEGDIRENKRFRKLEWLAMAMAEVQTHPEWSDATIARRVGRSKTTLSRNPTYQLAAGMARRTKNDLPQGHRDKETGKIEAYSESSEE